MRGLTGGNMETIRFETTLNYEIAVQGESSYRSEIESIFGFVDDEGVDEDGLIAQFGVTLDIDLDNLTIYKPSESEPIQPPVIQQVTSQNLNQKVIKPKKS